LIEDMVITGATESDIHLTEAKYDFTSGRHNLVCGGKTLNLEGIGTVIYCTGYYMNLSMLHPSLKYPLVNEDYREMLVEDLHDWTMSENSLTETFGNIKPSFKSICCDELSIYRGLYRGILLSNPNMMFSVQGEVDLPLWELDVKAWLFLAHITGDFQLPTKQEVNRLNTQLVMKAMEIPTLRYSMDMNYKQAWNELDEDHWALKWNDPQIENFEEDRFELLLKDFARDLYDSGYPVNIGTTEKLNEKGKLIIAMEMECQVARTNLDPEDDDDRLKTFFDNVDPNKFISLHTGHRAVPLKKPFILIDDNDPNILKADC